MTVDVENVEVDKIEIFGTVSKIHNYCYLADNIFNEFDCSKKSLINHISKLKIKYLDNN
tara:strand:+ start:5797 stop:5973 length:177 start_codon:yes stop_codon:yes gene_type:complete